MFIIILYYYNPELLRDVYTACDVRGGTVVFNFQRWGRRGRGWKSYGEAENITR